MKFRYSATAKNGKKTSGELEADSKDLVLRDLRERGLFVTSLVEAEGPRQFTIGGVSALEKVTLTKHLGIMLRSGIPLDEALRILESEGKGKLKRILKTVREDVQGGDTLSDSLGKYPETFNNYYIHMIRAGEQSGRLSENLELLADRFSKDYELTQKALSAMLYPALIFGMTVGLGVIISVFVLPRLSGLFTSFQFELPWTTRVLIIVSDFIRFHGFITAIILVTSFVVTVWASRAKQTRSYFHRLYLRLPVVSTIARSVNLSRFATVFGSLLKSGVPINQAVTVTAQVLSNEAYRAVLTSAVARVNTGESLSTTLAGAPHLFPHFSMRMMRIGEETGKLEDVLDYLGQFYENELDNTLKNLSTMIEPVLLVTIGAIVALVALSIISPIYNFVGSVG